MAPAVAAGRDPSGRDGGRARCDSLPGRREHGNEEDDPSQDGSRWHTGCCRPRRGALPFGHGTILARGRRRAGAVVRRPRPDPSRC